MAKKRERTKRRTWNSKLVAEWNVEIAQPASSIWLTHTCKSGRQADRYLLSTCPSTVLPTLLPFFWTAVQLLHFISVTCFPFFSETLVLFFVGHEWLVFAMLPPLFFSLCICVCVWTLSVELAFVCKCGHLISICVLDCFALHLLIFAI